MNDKYEAIIASGGSPPYEERITIQHVKSLSHVMISVSKKQQSMLISGIVSSDFSGCTKKREKFGCHQVFYIARDSLVNENRLRTEQPERHSGNILGGYPKMILRQNLPIDYNTPQN